MVTLRARIASANTRMKHLDESRQNVMKRSLFKIARALVVAYVLVTIMLASLQRQLLFPAPPPRAVRADLGELIEGRSAHGRRVVAHWARAREDAPAVAFFHGNGAQLADSADLATVFLSEGWSVFSVEYPGYGPLASDSPSEESIVDVADGAMALLRTRLAVPTAHTVLVGQSLGTGVATALAARGAGAKLVLISPFRSVSAVANDLFRGLPVGLLVRDRFDSEALAPTVTIPTLVIHGTADEVIPFSHGEAISKLFSHGRLVRVERGRHNDLWSEHIDEVLNAMRAFVRLP